LFVIEKNAQREVLHAKIYSSSFQVCVFLSHVGDHPKMSLRKLSKTGNVFRHLVNYPLRTK